MRMVNFSGRIDCLFAKKKKTFKLCQIIFLHLTVQYKLDYNASANNTVFKTIQIYNVC